MKKLLCIIVTILFAYSIYANEKTNVIESSNGIGIFNGDNVSIKVFLVNDLNQTLDIWSKPDSEGFPKIETTSRTSSNNGIIPFIVYSFITEQKNPYITTWYW